MRQTGFIVLSLLGGATVLFVVGQDESRIGGASTQSLPGRIEEHSLDSAALRVIDGDTLAVRDERIRLFGIDAPEGDQICSRDGRPVQCGEEATAQLQALVANRQVFCKGVERDRYGRLVATCSVEGRDIGRHMVASGWAVAFSRYSGDYLPDENAARAAGFGLWQGDFQRPEKWRKEH